HASGPDPSSLPGGCSSPSAGRSGTRYSSPSQRPRSTSRQRGLQKGKAGLRARGSAGFLQVGQRGTRFMGLAILLACPLAFRLDPGHARGREERPLRAVRIEQPGSPSGLGITEVEDPVPGTGEVLVDVHASALNRADWYQILGKYPP